MKTHMHLRDSGAESQRAELSTTLMCNRESVKGIEWSATCPTMSPNGIDFDDCFKISLDCFISPSLNVFTGTLSSHPPPHLLQVSCIEGGSFCTLIVTQHLKGTCAQGQHSPFELGGGGGAGKESKASKFLAVKRVAWFLLDSVFEAKFCFQSNTANSHWPQQESWVSIWGQSLSPSFFLWIKERETACSRITKSKLMHQTHLLLHIHFVHTHILPCTCYFTFVCETKTQEHVSLPFLRTVNQISESSKFLLIGVRLIKTVLDTALHPSFLDALLLSEWNLLHKVLVLAGTSWQCHTQQRRCWASRWYGDGMSGEGNLIANVIAQGKTEIPPLF